MLDQNLKVQAGKRTLNWLNDPLLLFRSTTAEIHREHIATLHHSHYVIPLIQRVMHEH